MKNSLLLFLVLSLFSTVNSSVLIEDWSDVDFTEQEHLFDDIKNGVSDAIFNAISSEIGYSRLVAKDRLNVGFNIKRRIFSNRDAQESYTVIDYFGLPMSSPFNFTVFSNPNVSLNLGVQLNTQFINIRKVQPVDLDLVTSVDELEREGKDILTQIRGFPKFVKTKDVEDDISSAERVSPNSRHFSHDPEMRARYSKIWNMLVNPFRLPLTERAARKMDIGEISSYDLSGYLQFGMGVGFGLAPVDPLYIGNSFNPLNINASLTSYIKGNFRVSVMKESENKVLVKVSKLRGAGLNGNVRLGTGSFKPLSGIVVIEGLLDLSVVPFNISVSKGWEKRFDVGYRFDLDDPDAVEAYLKAVMGRMKLAEELSLKKEGVEKVFNKVETSDSFSFGHNISVSYLFNSTRSVYSRFSEAEIMLPSGERKVFKAYNSVSKSYGGWVMSENHSQSFSVTYDDPNNTNEDELLTLRINGTWNDSRTVGSELALYVNNIKNLMGDAFTIPNFPLFSPTKKCARYRRFERRTRRDAARRATDIINGGFLDRRSGDDDLRDNKIQNLCKKVKSKINYRSSHFSIRLGFNKQQVDKFINFPEEEMWPILEKAFSVKEGRWSSRKERIKDGFRNVFQSFFSLPVFIFSGEVLRHGTRLVSAKAFLEQWKELKHEENNKDLTKRFRKLFQTAFHGYERMRIIVEAMKYLREPYLVHMNAVNNDTFGNINIFDDDFLAHDPIDDEINRELNFDYLGSRDYIDELAVFENIRVGRKGKNKVYIIFKLHQKPKFMYIKVDRDIPLRTKRNYLKMVINNRNDILKVGENVILVTPDSKDGIAGRLAPFLFSKERLSLGFSISNNGKQWGVLTHKRLKKLK